MTQEYWIVLGAVIGTVAIGLSLLLIVRTLSQLGGGSHWQTEDSMPRRLRALFGRTGRAAEAATPEIRQEIVDALSIYMGGNHDVTRLRALVASHPETVQDTILQYQARVAGRCEQICDLAIVLGYVEHWCNRTHSRKLLERRQAFACLSAVAHYEPVRRFMGNIPEMVLRDPDEQIRLDAARILLSTGDATAITQVLESVLADTPGVREAIAGELGRYAMQLCTQAVPQSLRSHPREMLKLLVSWERALPLPDMREAAGHSDPEIRLEVVRLLPFLPATPQNRSILSSRLTDEDHRVRAAAAAAADVMRIPHPDSKPSPVPDGHPELAFASGDWN